MKLFVNGDSHTAQVYPTGITATEQVATQLGYDYENIALAGGSNQRIIRTTQQKLTELDPNNTIIVIGWSSFERTEYCYNHEWHQISGEYVNYSVDDDLDALRKERTEAYLNAEGRTFDLRAEQHDQIYVFHQLLNQLGYEHVFYQGCRTHFFDREPEQTMFRHDWNNCWVHDPYVKKDWTAESFSQYAEKMGCKHADPWDHYGQDAHDLWAKVLVAKIQQLKIN